MNERNATNRVHRAARNFRNDGLVNYNARHNRFARNNTPGADRAIFGRGRVNNTVTRPGTITRAPMFNRSNRGVNTTTATSDRAARNPFNADRNPGLFRTNRANNTTRIGGYRNTAVDTRTSTITFIILLSAIAALLALAIYALMRRPRNEYSHSHISDADSAGRRR
jgi:hypothetical protein